MKNVYLFLLIFGTLFFISCEKDQTQTGDQKNPIDLIGTAWIYEDGTITTTEQVKYYLYREAVVVNGSEISSEVWSSLKKLNLTSVTDLSASGCMWAYLDKKATYTYNYPSIPVSYNGTMIGKATIASDNKSATMEPVDATINSFDIIKLDAVRDIANDPWAATSWSGKSRTIQKLTLGNYNKLFHISTSYIGPIGSAKYEYKQVGNELIPYIDIVYVGPGSLSDPEPSDYYKYTYTGHIENIPGLGYRFVITTHYAIKYTRYISEYEMWCETDTLKQVTL